MCANFSIELCCFAHCNSSTHWVWVSVIVAELRARGWEWYFVATLVIGIWSTDTHEHHQEHCKYPSIQKLPFKTANESKSPNCVQPPLQEHETGNWSQGSHLRKGSFSLVRPRPYIVIIASNNTMVNYLFCYSVYQDKQISMRAFSIPVSYKGNVSSVKVT